MVTNEQIRRARPSVDSPLGRLIKGEINKDEYQRAMREKRDRESHPDRQAASEQP
jgi:hypothetical protein